MLILNKLHLYQSTAKMHYDNMEFGKVCLLTLNFISQLSSEYLHLCKDRLYCDGDRWPSRQAALYTLLMIARGISSVLAPITPLLTEEMGFCCPVLKSPFRNGWVTERKWAENTNS